jgi:small acid-soluble spore protein H (minor)
MDNKRAKEIVSSPEMVDVTYNGNPIYIEEVYDNDNTAKIHYLDEPDKKTDVALVNLVEH